MNFSITAHLSYFVFVNERNLREYVEKMEVFPTIINSFYQILILS